MHSTTYIVSVAVIELGRHLRIVSEVYTRIQPALGLVPYIYGGMQTAPVQIRCNDVTANVLNETLSTATRITY